jgi:hypothetical protein
LFASTRQYIAAAATLLGAEDPHLIQHVLSGRILPATIDRFSPRKASGLPALAIHREQTRRRPALAATWHWLAAGPQRRRAKHLA